MRYKIFSKTHLKVSVIGLGAWQAGFKSWGRDYSKKDILEAYDKAFKLGINFIDTAEIYGDGRSEKVIAEFLSDKRDEFVIATKVAGYNATPSRIEKSALSSLSRLNIDVIDIYQIHWPPSYYTSLQKVFSKMEALIDKGIVNHIGVSNFPKKLLEKSVSLTRRYDIVCNQVQYNLLFRAPEKGLFNYMRKNKIELIAWSPLAKGALAGKIKADSPAKKYDSVFKRAWRARELFEILNKLSEKYSASLSQISLAWIIAKGAYPIPGVKRPSHVIDNAHAADIKLDKRDVEMLDKVTEIFKEGDIASILPRVIPNFLSRIMIRVIGGV
jgi:aryl-alcohol dehydrogenase-like predicted oxidoreductase